MSNQKQCIKFQPPNFQRSQHSRFTESPEHQKGKSFRHNEQSDSQESGNRQIDAPSIENKISAAKNNFPDE